ncbi:hypothetical protein HK100_010940, partial [Physocladia obscura]
MNASTVVISTFKSVPISIYDCLWCEILAEKRNSTMSDISSAVERAKAVAAKLTAAAKAAGQLPDSIPASSYSIKRARDDDPPTSGYSKRENLYGSTPTPTTTASTFDANKRPRDDYNEIPISGYVPKQRAGLGSDDATNSFLAKLGLSGGMVSTKISREVNIPADMVGLIIGKGGETLKRIQAESGVAKIQFNQDRDSNEPTRITTLIGTEDECEKAAKMIDELVSNKVNGPGGFGGNIGVGGSHYGPKGTTVSMEVSGDRVGLVIGKGGETIRMLQAKTGAKITVIQDGNPRQGFKTVTIQGSDEQIEESKKMIEDIVAARVMVGSGVVQGYNNTPTGQEMEEVKVPNDRVGLVIGKGGESCKSIQYQFGVKLQFEQMPDANNERTIKVYGSSREAISGAIDAIFEKAGHVGHRGFVGGASASGVGMGMNPYANYGGYGGTSQGYSAATAGYGGATADPYSAMASQYALQTTDYSQYYDQSQAAAYYDPAAYAAYAQQAAAAQNGTTADESANAAAQTETTTGEAGGDEAANAAAWAAYYAYYAQYGGDPSQAAG